MISRLFLVLALALLSVSPAAAMIDTLAIPELVRQAELILLGEVERQTDLPGLPVATDASRPSHATGAPQPLSRVESVVRPIRFFKGASPADQRLSFITLGAVSGQPWFEDEPRFPPVGRQVLLFLQKGKAGYEPVNLIQGVWPLDPTRKILQGMGFGYSLEDIQTEIKSQRGTGK